MKKGTFGAKMLIDIKNSNMQRNNFLTHLQIGKQLKSIHSSLRSLKNVARTTHPYHLDNQKN